jgi:hypothetical protein
MNDITDSSEEKGNLKIKKNTFYLVYLIDNKHVNFLQVR